MQPAKSPATGSQEPDLPGFFWLREVDLNHRPSGYEPDELPGCSIPRKTGLALIAPTRYLAIGTGLGKGARRGNSSYYSLRSSGNGAAWGDEPDSSRRGGIRPRRAV